jgi:hypothetical protein
MALLVVVVPEEVGKQEVMAGARGRQLPRAE